MSEKNEDLPETPLNGIYGWDITVNAKDYTIPILKELLNLYAKTWVFQEELGGKTNYLHYQVRVSLKAKTRTPWNHIKGRWSITSTNDRADKSRYTTKCETRVSGPYRHDDKRMHRDLVGLVLRPWQQKIVDLCRVVYPPRDERLRIVNVLVDPEGSIGKGLLVRYLRYHLGAVLVPPYRDIDRMAGYIAKLPRRASIYLVDFPRDTNYKKLGDFYRGMENIKDGYLSDWRYTSIEDEMDMQPHIWIFSNQEPRSKAFTPNRWRIHTIESLLITDVPTFDPLPTEGWGPSADGWVGDPPSSAPLRIAITKGSPPEGPPGGEQPPAEPAALGESEDSEGSEESDECESPRLATAAPAGDTIWRPWMEDDQVVYEERMNKRQKN